MNEITFKTAQIYDYHQGSALIPTIDRFSRYTSNDDGTYDQKNPLDNHCWKMWHSAVMTWDGKVVPCCFDKDASYEMGNLRETPLKDVWYSGQYEQFRKMLLQSRSEIEICKNCSEGLGVYG